MKNVVIKTLMLRGGATTQSRILGGKFFFLVPARPGCGQTPKGALRNPVRLRGELLAALKERTGLKYREIAELDIFEGLSLIIIRLRTMYKNYRSRCRKGLS